MAGLDSGSFGLGFSHAVSAMVEVWEHAEPGLEWERASEEESTEVETHKGGVSCCEPARGGALDTDMHAAETANRIVVRSMASPFSLPFPSSSRDNKAHNHPHTLHQSQVETTEHDNNRSEEASGSVEPGSGSGSHSGAQ